MNKIVSISSYGSNPRYVEGMHRQYELAKVYYPGWEFRAYVDNAADYHLPDATVIEVKDGSHGVFWRFEPLFESDDNIVIVRDSDSRASAREAMAVSEWVESGKRLHVIRDHDAHTQYSIMAGLFGLRGRLSAEVYNVMRYFRNTTNYYSNDQVFLQENVWELLKHDCMSHAYNQGWFGETRGQLKNEYDFCGNGYDEHDMPLYPNTLAKCVGFDPKNVSEVYRFNG